MQGKAPPPSDHWFVHVAPRRAGLDGHGRDVLAEVRQLGLTHVEAVRSSRVYLLAGSLGESDVEALAAGLLADPVAERFDIGSGLSHRPDGEIAIEVHVRPGVMSPVALTTRGAANRLLRSKHAQTAEDVPSELVRVVDVARRYEIVGAANTEELDAIATKVLANACIETWYIQGLGRRDAIPDTFPDAPHRDAALRHVPLASRSDDELMRLSREAHLFLDLAEMQTIRDHFGGLGRDPTDLELETLAQTWSEHCVHKTLKSAIDYRGDGFGSPDQVRVRFDNLLKETIVAVTEKLDRDWCLSVFVDNAGVVAFDETYGIAFKAETHNHPSAIEPYGGAATGIGGCIRDIMGCGLGAKPIASTDVFCLARPDYDADRLPADVLHPRRVLKGVVGGVRDYGNRMGIPTVNGALFFDDRYLANPLVFCGCVGLIPRDRIDKDAAPGDRIVVVGGATGRDGIHGATFSSAELTDSTGDEFAHAVQIGHAIEEKKVLDAMLMARDHADGCLYSAVTDCGAGGLSSAVGEMGERIGAEVELEHVPLKYAGLRYDEIWISEAQERMVFAVPPEKLDVFLGVFASEEVQATVIGTFTSDRMLCVRYGGAVVGQLDMAFLHDGRPRSVRTATWTADAAASKQGVGSEGSTHDAHAKTKNATERTFNEQLLDALGDLNVASKEWVIRQYDHEVQGRSAIKPLVGPRFGPSDAAVLRPRFDSYQGIALACGLCPQRSDTDPYWMAVAAVDEALRNVICVGAKPDRTSILDNFCWPKVDTPQRLGGLVRACRGAADVALAYGLPFVSGKDSLNNEFSMSEDEARRVGLPRQLAIPATLLISALGMVHDVRRCVSMDLKEPGASLVLASAPVDRVGFDRAMALHDHVSALIRRGMVLAAHDVSDGGIAVTLAEMCIASGLGASVDLAGTDVAEQLFSELTTSYVLEMSGGNAEGAGLPIIGRVEETPVLAIEGVAPGAINLGVDKLDAAWRRPLADGGGRCCDG